MYSENGVLIDFDEVSKLVANADVFTVGFANFAERLMVDARANETEVPLVKVVEPAGSPQRRLRWLMRRRPSLGKPEAFSFIAWPHSPRLLVESGIWDRIVRRSTGDIDPAVREQCDTAMTQLMELDMEASLNAIKGEHYATIYSRQGLGGD